MPERKPGRHFQYIFEDMGLKLKAETGDTDDINVDVGVDTSTDTTINVDIYEKQR